MAPWGRDIKTQTNTNRHIKARKHLKESKQLYFPLQDIDDCKPGKDTKNVITKHPHIMGATRNNEPTFLHGNSLGEAVWSCKIHVQIMRFTCCLNMAFTWKGLNWALICMQDVTRESVAAVTDHFAEAFVRENVARVYMTLRRRNDVRKLDTDAILFWEIKCKKRDI